MTSTCTRGTNCLQNLETYKKFEIQKSRSHVYYRNRIYAVLHDVLPNAILKFETHTAMISLQPTRRYMQPTDHDGAIRMLCTCMHVVTRMSTGCPAWTWKDPFLGTPSAPIRTDSGSRPLVRAQDDFCWEFSGEGNSQGSSLALTVDEVLADGCLSNVLFRWDQDRCYCATCNRSLLAMWGLYCGKKRKSYKFWKCYSAGGTSSRKQTTKLLLMCQC